MRVICFFLLVPSLLQAQAATVDGKVSNAAGGQPVPKAVVTLIHADPAGPGLFPVNYTTSTDAAGHFAMAPIEPGKYRMQVSRNGFVPATYNGNAIFALAAGQSLKDVAFSLFPQGVVSGRVLDEDGEPMPSARVQLLAWRFVQGKRQLGGNGFATTNDLGEYRVFPLAPGVYSLNVSAGMPGGAPTVDRSATPQPEGQYISVDYPKPIDVKAGQQVRGIDMTISKQSTVHVRGHIVSSVPGRHNYTLFLMGGGPVHFSGRQMVNASGDFDIAGVMPGRYTLQAGFPVDVSYYATNLVLEVKNKSVDNVTLNVGKPVAVSGHATADGALPLGSLLVHAQLEGADSMAMLSADSKIAPDGSFRFAEVSPGRYTVTVENLPEGYFGKSAAFEVSAAVPKVEIAVVKGAGVVSGKTTPGATVALIGAVQKVVSADPSGAFVIGGVPPGAYQAYAWASAEKAGYLDADYMRTLEGKGVTVTIAGAEQKTVPLSAIQ